MTPVAAVAAQASAQIALGARVRLTRADGSAFESTGKAALLLAMAGLEGPFERRRAALMLWPQSPEQQARNNLRTLVHRLNQRFGGELLVGSEHLAVEPSQAHVATLDAAALLAALAAGSARRCELLSDAGVEADASDELRAWLDSARQRLRRLQLSALNEALAAALGDANTTRGDTAQSNPTQAIALARACVQLEPLSEQAHRQLMDTLVRCGDRAAALMAYEDCKHRLRQELGVMPDVQTRTVHLRILQDQTFVDSMGHVPDPALVPPSAAVTLASGLTPLGGAARYPLIEREAVLAEVLAALAQGQHVALQGEAGVGKTRLLRQLADDGQLAHSQFEQVSIRPGARNEPYAALAQLLQELQTRRAPRIGVPEQVELARLAPLAFPGVRASQASLSAPRLHAALRHWISRLADTGVQRLVLDDVHYADAASQAAFAALLVAADDAAQAPPTLLLAHRTDEIDPALADALVAAQVRRQARCIALARLSLLGIAALLEAMHAEHSQAQAARLLQRTGGNPLFVIELAEHARDQAEQVGAGANLDALLRSRLALCSAAAQQLAAVAAVAEADFSVELAAAVTGQPPLALMPAWSELQHRGLFAESGLAHDLIRDAVMGAMPTAIRRTLHRQVAGHLEALGLKGARILRHWLAGEDPDHALPHAVHELHANSAAGLPTMHMELALLGLLERVSDAVLLGNLWVTAEVHGDAHRNFVPIEIWQRLKGLVVRVERCAASGSSAVWLAFERSRQLFQVDKSLQAAYETLRSAVEGEPAQGVARAYSENQLAFYAYHLGRGMHEHGRRSTAALAELPDDLPLRRLRMVVESVKPIYMSPVESIRAEARSMRHARRRGDLAAAFEARAQIARLYATVGYHATAHRHFEFFARTLVANARDQDPYPSRVVSGIAAFNCGRFNAALQHITLTQDSGFIPERPLFLALLQLRLGDVAQALAHARCIEPGELQSQFTSHFLHAVLQAELEQQRGQDPLPALRQSWADMQRSGIGGAFLGVMAWEISLRAKPATERIPEGEALLSALKAQGSNGLRVVRTLLELAEAKAEVGDPASLGLALEAARLLRRGCTSFTLYLPDGLVRCARLLAATDPSEAASLMHVAQRWVRQALPHVPDFARESFAAVPINRLLLADDPAAAVR